MKDEAIEALRAYAARCRQVESSKLVAVPRPLLHGCACSAVALVQCAPAASHPAASCRRLSPRALTRYHTLPLSSREVEGELATRDAQLAALESRLHEQAEASAQAAAAAEEEAAAALADAKERVQVGG